MQMAWVRLDDKFAQHEKVLEAGPLGMALHVAGICYASGNLTDGFIKKAVIPVLADFEEIDEAVGQPGFGRRMALEKLIAAGLWAWDDERKGYWIHDYLDYNPSAETVLAKREQDRKRKRPEAEGDMSDSKRNPEGIQTESTPPVPVSRTQSPSKTQNPSDSSSPPAKPKPAKSRTYDHDSEEYRLARLLARRVHEVNEKAKVPKDEAGLQRWANTMRLMIERDGHTSDEIRQTMAWALDDGFWQALVQSPDYLREKFATIWGQMQRADRPAPNSQQAKVDATFAVINDWSNDTPEHDDAIDVRWRNHA